MTIVTVIPGDGIGPQVIDAALRTVDALGIGITFEVLHEVNAAAYRRQGSALNERDLARIAASTATLLGAVGQPDLEHTDYVRSVLFRLRREFDLYINHRPARLLDARLSPLRDTYPRDINCIIVRENTEGLYSGIGGALRPGSEDECAIDLDVNTYRGVSRIVEYGFSIADRSVCMIDKANAVRNGGQLWQRCLREAAQRHAGIPASHLYVDAAAMKLLTDPASFDVVVTNNSYGDILSDLAAVLAGGIGLASSANLNADTGFGLFEPVHGSAPDLVGTGTANPMAAILTSSLMLRHLQYDDPADAIDRAVASVIAAGRVTPDLGGTLRTHEVAAAVIAAL